MSSIAIHTLDGVAKDPQTLALLVVLLQHVGFSIIQIGPLPTSSSS